jgi:hypothetical protein
MYGFNKYLNRSNDEANLSLCEVKVLDADLHIINRTSILITKGEQTYTGGKVQTVIPF